MRDGFLKLRDYATVIECVPILCVDIDLVTEIDAVTDGHVLFKRCNEPLKGEWWVLGGRIFKGETAIDAVRRKLKEEAGLGIQPPLKFTGFYEDTYDFSSIGRGKYHTVSLMFEMRCDPSKIVLDSQHSEWMISQTLPKRLDVQVGTVV